MKSDNSVLVLDREEQNIVWGSNDTAVALRTMVRPSPFHGVQFTTPGLVASNAVVGNVFDIGGAYVFSMPSVQWYGFETQNLVSIEVLEDKDIKFEPKATRIILGIIAKRKRGEF